MDCTCDKLLEWNKIFYPEKINERCSNCSYTVLKTEEGLCILDNNTVLRADFS